MLAKINTVTMKDETTEQKLRIILAKEVKLELISTKMGIINDVLPTRCIPPLYPFCSNIAVK